MSDIVQPLELIVGTTPTASVNVPPTANRIRVENWTNQWVHITGPIDRFVGPFKVGLSYLFTLPFSQQAIVTATFEAPPGWAQATGIATQKCLIIISEESHASAENTGGDSIVTPAVYVEHFEDNVDPGHPYNARFYIPQSIAAAISITLSYLANPYRYYVSAASSGAATSSGGSSSPTSNSNLPSHTHTETTQPNTTFFGPGHEHSYNDASAQQSAADSGPHNHIVTIPSHSHTVTVTTTLSPGIVEELTPTSWALAIDGNPIAAPPLNALDLDILPYLTKDVNGNPAPGWHSILWTPDRRGRVQADLVVQLVISGTGIALAPASLLVFEPTAFDGGAFT